MAPTYIAQLHTRGKKSHCIKMIIKTNKKYFRDNVFSNSVCIIIMYSLPFMSVIRTSVYYIIIMYSLPLMSVIRTSVYIIIMYSLPFMSVIISSK